MSSIVLSHAQGRPSLAAILPNCAAAISGREGELGLPAVDQAVVLLVDGLGSLQLRARAGHARHLVEGWGKRDTAFSFPSTTVSGITTLTTGCRAGEHGMLAYTVLDRATGLVRNQLSGWGEAMDPATWQPVPTIFERLEELAPGAVPFVVGMPDYEDSGLTQASLRGAEYVPADSVAERIDATLELLARNPRCLIYLYVAELDQAGHRFGWESDPWLAALEELDSAVGTLRRHLPKRAGLLVTADHGMLDIPFERQIDIDLDGPLAEGVEGMGGEPRLRHLYLEERAPVAHAEALAERWRAAEGSRALVVTKQEAIDAGWYGDAVTDAARSRIGDVIVAAQKLVSYYPAGLLGPGRLVLGQHGSTTPEETLVPLIRHGAFAR
ncbi:hypothetical protein USB125703_01729 [Pseudoclavibacter triregionum]|nr:hypothetical protein USB125703_01729 [Pseudoclavibacter triregionum]